jgi:hypothetical protein
MVLLSRSYGIVIVVVVIIDVTAKDAAEEEMI